ncbi:MAG: coproporphyrinogen III oxidase family protein [Bacteroidales bacterium]|nr:coproporphyrinogen III oxidase family protein [Bacteroidales bacterium]
MVYLHVPFCRSFCTYCDFYSEIACRGRDAQLFEAYTQAVCAEASRRRDEIEATRDLNTLYIGGGTPSVLPLMILNRIVDIFGSRPAPFIEFTIEVNPEDIVEKGEDYVRGLLDLGVNRVSMGVQSLDDGILRWMNRRHDAAHARQAFRILRSAGVGNISVDLIFGLSQLSEAILSETLAEVLAWRPEHVSAYQLSIEPGSALAGMVREGRYAEATQEQCAAQYRLLCEALGAAGYVHYEISNWALPGFRAIHNSAYWTRHPYVGLGPAAHSFDGTARSWNPDALPHAQAATASGNRATLEYPGKACFSGGPTLGIVRGGTASEAKRWGPTKEDVAGGSWPLRGDREELSEEEAKEEEIMLGLRTARGIPEGLVAPERAEVMLADGRLARLDGGRLRIPEDHWFVSDDIIADLI